MLFRALYSPAQLFERTVELWNDHLHTAVDASIGPFVKTDYDRDVRRHAFGRFRDLLGASAHSPAMLDYLTNNTNERVPNSSENEINRWVEREKSPLSSAASNSGSRAKSCGRI